MVQSSTGVNEQKRPYKEALIFGDNTCPKCGNKMRLDEKRLKGENLRVRYICDKCKYVCPVGHNEDNLNRVSPIYDATIYDFLFNFGKSIRKRIEDMQKRKEY